MRADEFHTSIATFWSTIQPWSLSSFRYRHFTANNRFSTQLLTLLRSFFTLCCCRRRRSSRGRRRRCSLLGRTPPLRLAWIPVPDSGHFPQQQEADKTSRSLSTPWWPFWARRLSSRPWSTACSGPPSRSSTRRATSTTSTTKCWTCSFFCCKLTWRKLLKYKGWIVDQEDSREVWNSSPLIYT